jgi:hypothetical protein
MRPTSASQRMASSLAFLKIPFRRFEKVTCRLVELSILRITIFPLPISLIRLLTTDNGGGLKQGARTVMNVAGGSPARSDRTECAKEGKDEIWEPEEEG